MRLRPLFVNTCRGQFYRPLNIGACIAVHFSEKKCPFMGWFCIVAIGDAVGVQTPVR